MGRDMDIRFRSWTGAAPRSGHICEWDMSSMHVDMHALQGTPLALSLVAAQSGLYLARGCRLSPRSSESALLSAPCCVLCTHYMQVGDTVQFDWGGAVHDVWEVPSDACPDAFVAGPGMEQVRSQRHTLAWSRVMSVADTSYVGLCCGLVSVLDLISLRWPHKPADRSACPRGLCPQDFHRGRHLLVRLPGGSPAAMLPHGRGCAALHHCRPPACQEGGMQVGGGPTHFGTCPSDTVSLQVCVLHWFALQE